MKGASLAMFPLNAGVVGVELGECHGPKFLISFIILQSPCFCLRVLNPFIILHSHLLLV